MDDSNISLDELNKLLEQSITQYNASSLEALCGLSPDLMHNWQHNKVTACQHVSFSTPTDVSQGPVMRYVQIILNNLLDAGGAVKLTDTGAIPTRIVRQADALASELPVEPIHYSISPYRGRREGDFMAFEYARLLMQIARIVYIRSGHICFNKSAQKRYKAEGARTFYVDLLDAAGRKFNWAYFDGWPEEIHIRPLWLYMIWRLQKHSNMAQLTQEVAQAVPFLLQHAETPYVDPIEALCAVIRTRFIERFLGFFGLVYPPTLQDDMRVKPMPLLRETFEFHV